MMSIASAYANPNSAHKTSDGRKITVSANATHNHVNLIRSGMMKVASVSARNLLLQIIAPTTNTGTMNAANACANHSDQCHQL